MFSHQDCNAPFVVEDLKAFESDEKVIKKIVRTSVEQRLLGSDSALKACPSPNCEGVFRRYHHHRRCFLSPCFDRLETGEELQEGEAFLCHFCGSKICRRFFSCFYLNCCFALRCESVFHNGMTCQFYKIFRADDNHSLRVGSFNPIYFCCYLCWFFLIRFFLFADIVGIGLAC